jgi:RNA polymerase sigma-70 factor (ECF subfamily)
LTPARQQEIERLFREYGKGVGSYALARVGDPELAEEITARVFLQVVRNFEQLRGPAAPWLWTIVRTELAKHFRSPRIHRPLDELPPDGEGDPVAELERRETAGRLQKALADLSEVDQQLIGMRFFLNQSNVDIAAALGLTPSNVGVRLYRALRQLRGLMELKST